MNIVITGASTGIGKAVVEHFAEDATAHHFGLCSSNINKLMRTESEIGAHHPQHIYHSRAVDVRDQTEVDAFAKGYLERFRHVDILINNAGIGLFRSVSDISVSEFRNVLDVNLRSMFLVTKAFLPSMLERNNGTIIAISSLAGKNGFANGSAYCASKFGVRGLMQSLFFEVRDRNIRVVTICPGSVDTPFFDTVAKVSTSRPDRWLKADDVARCIRLACELPIGATLSEFDLRPTNP